MSTSHNKRRAVRGRMAETGESYTTALRALSAGGEAPAALDTATPPADWSEHASKCPAVAAIWRDRDGDGRDELAVFDASTGARIGSLVVPHVPARIYTELAEQKMARSGTRPDSPAGLKKVQQAALGEPNRLIQRLNHEAYILCDRWQRWSDGSWRIPAEPTHFTHSVTVTTLDAQAHTARLVVIEHPDTTVVDEVVKVRFDRRDGQPYFVSLNRLLDRYGYVVDGGLFEDIAPGVQYRRARAGHLAQRYWLIRANLRLLRDVTSHRAEGAPRTFTTGETVTMQREGSAGREVWLGGWHSNSDLEVSFHLRPEDVEVVEILDDWPPMHAEAGLDADTVTTLLAPHHEGAAEAVAAWAAAGLHLSHGRSGLEIRTPAPEYRLIGRVDRDYWNKNRHSKPYTAVLRDNADSWPRHEVRLDALPLDPVAVLGRSRRAGADDWTLPADASAVELENLVEDLLRRGFAEELVAEVLDDDSSIPTGFRRLVDVCREVAKGGPVALSSAFAAVAADHADPATLDDLLYGDRGPGWELAERIETCAGQVRGSR